MADLLGNTVPDASRVREAIPGCGLSQNQPHRFCATVLFLMATRPQNPAPDPNPGSLYCPNCAEEVTDPLTCGDCSSVICRRCGTALESSDELGIG